MSHDQHSHALRSEQGPRRSISHVIFLSLLYYSYVHHQIEDYKNVRIETNQASIEILRDPSFVLYMFVAL